MTKEEQLKQEAEEYFKSICEDYNEEYERTGKRHYFVGFDIKNAYLASAEPREKRITELEKELEKAKKVQVVEHFEAYGQCRDSRRIASLETENAELKKQVEQKQHLADVRLEQSLENYKLFSDERKARIDVDIALEDMTDNLTKAKEHIRTLISCLINWVQEGDKDYCYITDAEQFLKESE